MQAYFVAFAKEQLSAIRMVKKKNSFLVQTVETVVRYGTCTCIAVISHMGTSKSLNDKNNNICSLYLFTF